MDIWTQRLILAQQGWHTEARITRSGVGSAEPSVRSFRFWAKRVHWSGWITDICLHDGCIHSINSPDMENGITRAVGRVFDACQLAHKDFSETVPVMKHPIADNDPIGLTVNSWAVDHLGEKREDFVPTEDLPDQISSYASTGSDTVVSAMLDTARDGFSVDDSMDTYFGRARYASDCKNRPWGWRLRLAYDDLNKTEMAYQPREISSNELDEALCAGLLTTMSQKMTAMRTSYANGDRQGSTENTFPAGFLTMAEFENNRRAFKRRP